MNWIIYTLIQSIIFIIIFCIGLLIPNILFKALFILGAFLFLYLSVNNPNHYLKKLATAFATLGLSYITFPQILRFKFENFIDKDTRHLIEQIRSAFEPDYRIGFALIAAGIVFSILDVFLERNLSLPRAKLKRVAISHQQTTTEKYGAGIRTYIDAVVINRTSDSAQLRIKEVRLLGLVKANELDLSSGDLLGPPNYARGPLNIQTDSEVRIRIVAKWKKTNLWRWARFLPLLKFGVSIKISPYAKHRSKTLHISV